MPVMDGYESTQKIREFYRIKQVPQPLILACTGHIENEYIQKAWASEIDQVIPKPFSFEIIKEVFNKMIQDDR